MLRVLAGMLAIVGMGLVLLMPGSSSASNPLDALREWKFAFLASAWDPLRSLLEGNGRLQSKLAIENRRFLKEMKKAPIKKAFSTPSKTSKSEMKHRSKSSSSKTKEKEKEKKKTYVAPRRIPKERPVVSQGLLPTGDVVSTTGKQCCPPGRIGAECDLVFTRTAYYLPEADALEPCDDQGKQLLMARLDQVQRGKCNPRRLDVHDMPAYGFGSIFSYAVYGLHDSLKRGRMAEQARGSLPGFSSCKSGNFECFLQPFSSCGGGRKHTMDAMTGKSTDKRIPWAPLRGVATDLFWYHSLLVGYLWKPNAASTAEVDRIAKEIGYGGDKCISLHVRHGDACADKRGQRKCHPLKSYMAGVNAMAAKYNISTVYLATDDDKVAKESAAYSQYKWVTQPMDRGFYKAKVRIEDRMKDKGNARKAGAVGMQAVVDIELLSRCDAFVGTFSTNLGRLAFQVMAARKGYMPPYQSLDIMWCAGFGNKNGKVLTAGGKKYIEFDC